MEHMKMKWLTEYFENNWRIVTDEDVDPWVICVMEFSLPGDSTGEKTAKLICELHNKELNLKSQKIDPNKCQRCGIEADKGNDRCIPPNSYLCKKCSEDDWRIKR